MPAHPRRRPGLRRDALLPIHRRQTRPPPLRRPHRTDQRKRLDPGDPLTRPLRLGAALQDVRDALGHADPRTTRRYDRTRHNLARSPNYLLATALTED